MPFTEAVIEQTQRFWQRRTGEAVAPDDARQAAGNVARLFELLGEWDRRAQEGRTTTDDQAPPGEPIARSKCHQAATSSGEGTQAEVFAAGDADD